MFQITDAHVERALAILNSDRHTKARAAYEKKDREKKVILARLEREANLKTVIEKQAYALCHPHYAAYLDDLHLIETEYFAAKDERDAADALLRAWQTASANSRGAERVR